MPFYIGDMMNKSKYILFFIVFLLLSRIVYANDIKNISMDIYVDNYGNAHITEVWDAYLSEGTEGYKPYYNLGNSEITDFRVSLNGKYFNTVDYWNVNGSFDYKKYNAGINTISNGYELCFGISEYGDNTYKMEYTITNFVSQLEDADMIYWQLIPYDLSDKPEYVSIKIYSDFKYDFELPVWGYGNYGGYAYIYDGYVELINEEGLNYDEYVTALIKFPKGTFDTKSIINKDFDYYLDMAEEGAVEYNDEVPLFYKILIGLVYILSFGIPIWLCIITPKKYGKKNLYISRKNRKVKDAPYFRDIPCDRDIFKAYWIACNYGLVKKQTDFLGAVLLKWLKNKNIENVIGESSILKKEERGFKLLSSENMNALEKQLFEMMMKASKDGVLESHEFTKWCTKNDTKILNWFDNVIDDVTMKYTDEGLIEIKKRFGKTYVATDALKNIALEVSGLKKFLNDFSNIKDRMSIEVQLWDEYLMYAQIFGIADKVAKEFKKLYPDLISEDVYTDIVYINTISKKGISAANSVARSRASSYSSGGGGFSSGGGGGGSFGGGGGGGGFR